MPRPPGQPGRRTRRTRLAALALSMLAFAIFAASCSSSDSSSSDKTSTTKGSRDSTATEVAANGSDATTTEVGSDAAVKKYVDSQGNVYAGDCADAKLPQDKGKWCSTLVSGDDASGTKTYAIGPVGEKPQQQITVKRKSSAQLTPGLQVGVADGNVGQPQQLTTEQLTGDIFITGNLVLDQAAGIGNGLADLPAGSTTGGGGGTGGTPPTGPPVVIVQPGDAQYPPNADIVVENPVIQVGGEVVFHGSGCSANETPQVSFDGTPIGTVTTDASGGVSGTITIPPGTAPGTHVVTVRGAVCVLNVSVTVAGAKLAFTGSSSHTGTYVLGSIAAIMLGMVLVVGTRRRRRGIHGRQNPPHASA